MLTYSVKPIGVEHGSDVLREPLSGGLVLCPGREPFSVTPSSDGNHELGVRGKALAHAVWRLEWLEGGW